MARTNTNNGGGASAEWGAITGNIQDQSDLQAEFDTKIDSIVAGQNVDVDNTDPRNPIVSANFTQEGKYMISGGAIWSGTGLVYDVSALEYFFNGNKTASQTSVTLDPSDPADNRLDAIVVDEAGTVTVITGDPSASPITPPIPDDQLAVQYILVEAGSTTPTVATESIYLDDPTSNWTFSTYTTATPATGSINFSGTISPKQGTNDIEASTDLRLGARFVRATSFDAFQYTVFSCWVRFTGTNVATNKSLNVRFENSAGTLVGNTINLFNYGLSRSTLNTWQLVVVPITAFGNLPATVKGLKVIMAGGTVGAVRQWDMDWILLTNSSAPSVNVPTINFYRNSTGIAAQSGLNLIEGTGVTIAAVNDPLNNRVNYTLSVNGQLITEGAPTQADRAEVDITVIDNDYAKIRGLQLKFGTIPNQQVLEFYDSYSGDPVPTAPIIGIDISDNYIRANDILNGSGSVIKDKIDYSSLVGTFSNGEQVRQVVETGQWFGSDPGGDARTIVFNTSGDFVNGYIGTDTLQASTGGKDSDVTLATITYSGLSGVFSQYEAVEFGPGVYGVVFLDNATNEMRIWLQAGTPVPTDTITGQESGATATLSTITTYAGQYIIGFSYAEGFTFGDAIQNFDTFATIYSDNGVDTMYTDVGGSFTVGGELYGTTSNATATVDSFTEDVYFNFINNGDTVTIGGKTYTFQDTLTNVDGNIQIGLNDTDSLQNLTDAINLTGTPGTQYAAATTINTSVSAQSFGSQILVTAKTPGISGNSIAVSQSIVSGAYLWDTATLAGGADPTVDDIASLISSKILIHNTSGIAKYNILADSKVISTAGPVSNTVTCYVMRPGTYGNGVAVDSTDDTAITTSAPTFTGGLNNGTIGIIGSLRKGIVITGLITGPEVNTKYNDCIFEAIDNNVWVIISSSDSIDNGYEWTNI